MSSSVHLNETKLKKGKMNEAADNDVHDDTDDEEPLFARIPPDILRRLEEELKPTVDQVRRDLEMAVRRLDAAKVQSLLARPPEGFDINTPTPDTSHSALVELIVCALEDEDQSAEAVKCIRLLAQHGADVNGQDRNGLRPLHLCAQWWRHNIAVELAHVLLEPPLSADPTLTKKLPPPQPLPVSSSADNDENDDGVHEHGHGEEGCTCGASFGGLLNTITITLVGGTKLEIQRPPPSPPSPAPRADEARPQPEQEEADVTPLHMALLSGNIGLGALLLSHGASISAYDADAGTVLHRAVNCMTSPGPNTAFILSQPGGKALVSVPNACGQLPLHMAVTHPSKLCAARQLVSAGADINARVQGGDDNHVVRANQRDMTPLLLACRVAKNGKMEPMVAFLLAAGADPNARGGIRQSALTLAAMAKSLPIVRLLVANGALVKRNKTKAAAAGEAEEKNGNNDDDGNNDHWPLSAAALLDEAGCEVDRRDREGHTPLIYVAGYYDAPGGGADQVIWLLVDRGADIEARVHDGRRALHYAAFKGNDACAAALISHGADLEAEDDNGWTPLHFAARYHQLGVVKLLLAKGAGVKKGVRGGPQPKNRYGWEFDIEGFTAADLARVVRGGQPTVDVLLGAGDVLSKTTKGLSDEDLFEEPEKDWIITSSRTS
ncbi:ankyrin repeat-containing domain protein [Podospora didyma]|uniref:Ankyrin repeat-containing domain protein n=1 Tax=Podospora didyma TaxID=330526 RepID=A0AAE0U246_9PEZI|nr:ankyrin repeat-containing domain protein [Podospora didyma]